MVDKENTSIVDFSGVCHKCSHNYKICSTDRYEIVFQKERVNDCLFIWVEMVKCLNTTV
jgi:hypothetical protein